MKPSSCGGSLLYVDVIDKNLDLTWLRIRHWTKTESFWYFCSWSKALYFSNPCQLRRASDWNLTQGAESKKLLIQKLKATQIIILTVIIFAIVVVAVMDRVTDRATSICDMKEGLPLHHKMSSSSHTLICRCHQFEKFTFVKEKTILWYDMYVSCVSLQMYCTLDS